MRQILALSCLLFGTFALAGGAGNAAPRPVAPFGSAAAARTLPANSLVKPGQTWVMSGMDASGKSVTQTYALSKDAPEWDDGWDFESEIGMLSYDPEAGSMFAGNFTENMLEQKPMNICLATVEGQQVRGLLFTGELEDIEPEFDKLSEQMGEAAPTYDALVKAAKAANVKAGTCTLTRQ